MSEKTLRLVAKPGIVLTLFVAVGTLVLWQINTMTKPRIIENYEERLSNKISSVLGSTQYDNMVLEDDVIASYANRYGVLTSTRLYRARSANKTEAVAARVTVPDGYSGKIELLIGVSLNGKLLGIEVIAHKETPGLGDAIESDKSQWSKQFMGKSLQNPLPLDWKVKKDGGKFDQLTGATITPRAIVATLKHVLNVFELNRDTLLFADAKTRIRLPSKLITE